jgi:hypothetical protein
MLLDHHKMVENSTMGEHWRRRWGGEPLVDEEGGGEAKQRKVGSRLDLDLWIRIQFSFIGPFLSFFLHAVSAVSGEVGKPVEWDIGQK